MRFNHFDKLMLLGGGDCLADLALKADMPVFVVTSTRHYNEDMICHNVVLSYFLNAHNINHVVVDNLLSKSVIENIPNSLAISFGAAWIFKEPFISEFKGNLVNAHGALLPRDRGAGGFSWRIMMGDNRGASLIHMIDPGVDTGDVIECKPYFFPQHCKKPIDFYEHSRKEYSQFLMDFCSKARSGHEFQRSGQPEYLSTYWPRLNTGVNGYINWSWSYDDVCKFICAFDDPYAGSSTFLNGSDVPLHLKSCSTMTSDGNFHPFQYGLVYRKSGHSFFIAANGGTVIVDKVLDSKGNDLSKIVNLGDRFFTPSEFLDGGLKSRPVYTPKGLK